MFSKKSQSKSSSSKRNSRGSSHSSPKFMPNLTQIEDAAKELPDPEIWPEESFTCPVEVDGKRRKIEFVIKTITRGSKKTPRWVYEGKVLIRKRDA